MTVSARSKRPQLDTPKRLFKTFQGHYHQLLADFHRSGAHKLPGGKGMLREDSIARFLSTWIPKRYEVISNVFISQFGTQFDRELDMVILDTFEGMAWPLDAAGVNSVVTWDHVKLVGEVKSKLTKSALNDAIQSMSGLPNQDDWELPFRVLFAFEVDNEVFNTLEESFATESSSKYPFDAFVFLDRGAYVSEKYEHFRKSFAKGLSPALGEEDIDIFYQHFSDDIRASHIPRGFGCMKSGKPSEALFAFAVLAAFASAGNTTTQALLTACRNADFSPILLEVSREPLDDNTHFPPELEIFSSEGGITLEDLPDFGVEEDR